MAEKKPVVPLLEEDDEFEEFPVEGFHFISFNFFKKNILFHSSFKYLFFSFVCFQSYFLVFFLLLFNLFKYFMRHSF